MSLMFVTRDLDLCSFDPTINEMPRVTVRRLCVKFDDRSCIGLWDIMWISRQTKLTNGDETPTLMIAVGVSNKKRLRN